MDDGTPLVGRHVNDRDWSWNTNNRVTAETVHIAPCASHASAALAHLSHNETSLGNFFD